MEAKLKKMRNMRPSENPMRQVIAVAPVKEFHHDEEGFVRGFSGFISPEEVADGGAFGGNPLNVLEALEERDGEEILEIVEDFKIIEDESVILVDGVPLEKFLEAEEAREAEEVGKLFVSGSVSDVEEFFDKNHPMPVELTRIFRTHHHKRLMRKHLRETPRRTPLPPKSEDLIFALAVVVAMKKKSRPTREHPEVNLIPEKFQ